MFTIKQIREIVSIVDYHQSFLVIQVLGKDVLDDFDKYILKQNGIDIDKIKEGVPTYFQSLLWGRLSSMLQEKDAKDIKYDDFLKYVKQGQYIPLSKREREEYEIAKQKTYTHLKGLGTKIKGDISNILYNEDSKLREERQKVIKEEIERGVLERKSLKSIVSEIGHRIEVWNHDWARIIETECNDIFQQGRANIIRDKFGDDALVFKDVYDGACFPIEDTEYMTNEGFKKLDDIRGDEKIMSFNLKTNYCEWANIRSIIRYNYNGDMHYYKNKTIDLLSTPNHNHLVGKRKKWAKENIYENILVPSENMRDLVHKDIMYLASDGWNGYEDEYINLCGKKIKTEYFAKFMGWWLSDGHIYFRHQKEKGLSSNSTQIAITQIKECNFKEIIDVCNGMFPDKNIYRCVDKFVILLDTSYDDLSKWFMRLGHAITKYIPKEILNLDQKYLLMFLNSFLSGDGHKEKIRIGKKNKEINDIKILYTSSKQMANDLCEVVLKCGYNPGFSIRDNIGRTTYKKNGGKIATKHLRYIIRINKRKYVKNINDYFSVVENWNGEVGCLELDKNYTLFIRRNNKSIWTGNCRHCIRLYLTNGIGSKPKLFKLSELEANGNNYGLKVADWKPVVGSTHAHCRCTLRNLPKGFEWDEKEGKFMLKEKKEGERIQRINKVPIKIGNVTKYI